MGNCRIFDRFGGLSEFCGETDPNTDSKANSDAGFNPEAFGHTNADTNAHSGCRNKSVSSSDGLWSCIL